MCSDVIIYAVSSDETVQELDTNTYIMLMTELLKSNYSQQAASLHQRFIKCSPFFEQLSHMLGTITYCLGCLISMTAHHLAPALAITIISLFNKCLADIKSISVR
jgi:two-component SAPR family response regulator